ncbi:hypothetical protein AVEN_198129-1 [Araneus ventricosus]|uniref:Uncharacterized protein n=1 Tax=Araneus ventricosus TaxID=182803 RepID=A0A4Y2F132_ARAVE|nr:hypothetical protein AVEN_198129-1 [Araneus ventricosus]
MIAQVGRVKFMSLPPQNSRFEIAYEISAVGGPIIPVNRSRFPCALKEGYSSRCGGGVNDHPGCDLKPRGFGEDMNLTLPTWDHLLPPPHTLIAFLKARKWASGLEGIWTPYCAFFKRSQGVLGRSDEFDSTKPGMISLPHHQPPPV